MKETQKSRQIICFTIVYEKRKKLLHGNTSQGCCSGVCQEFENNKKVNDSLTYANGNSSVQPT